MDITWYSNLILFKYVLIYSQLAILGQAHKFLSVNTMCTKFGSATDVEKKAILDRVFVPHIGSNIPLYFYSG